MEQLKPPTELKFTGNVEEQWRRFKQRFTLYLTAIGAAEKDGEQKIALLLTVAGTEAIDVFNSFQLTPDEQKDYDGVIRKFEQFCTPKRNETYERYVFNSKNQAESESVEEFITDLKLKCQSCNFGELADSLIRDRIVMGVRDKGLREKLLGEVDLTLERAIQICQAREVTQQRIKSMNSGTMSEAECKIETVVNKQTHKQSKASRGDWEQQLRSCGNCGGEHRPRQCPAFGKDCRLCGMRNHFARVCRQRRPKEREKKMNLVQGSDDEDFEELFVGSIGITAPNDEEWNETYNVNGADIEFKVDTGAQANTIAETELSNLKVKPRIDTKTKVRLRAYNGEIIPHVGKCKMMLKDGHKTHELEFVIVKGKKASLLGLRASTLLGLVKRVHRVNNEGIVHNIEDEYADVFKGIGKLEAVHKIQLEENYKPVIHSPRKVPLALRDKLKAELQRLEGLDIIEKVEEPTEWVHSLVIVERQDKPLRLCIDPKELNRYVKREHFQLPTRGEIFGDLAGTKYFSKLDASSGFWQVCLDKESTKICTFNTPFGRYSFKRLPFGLTSAPEVFHRTIQHIFERVPGTKVYIDDILICGATIEEHDARLAQALEAARSHGLKLNEKKCEFRKTEITFLGEVLTAEGVQISQSRVTAIKNMPPPTDKEGVQRFLGMVNYIGKFVPNLTAHTAQMRSLLCKTTDWSWNSNHQKEFEELKQLIIEAPVLKFYDEKRKTKISADASKSGLGAVLLQQYGNRWRPVAYSSRALTTAECNYAQIEKEALALSYACEKFHVFIYGKKVWAETDHKPLVTIAKKGLANTPPRVQRLFLGMQKYDLELEYSPGKELIIADTLSRAYDCTEPNLMYEQKDMVHVNLVRKSCPVSDVMWKKMAQATANDEVLQKIIRGVKYGGSTDSFPAPYGNFIDELSVIDGILFKGSRIVVPEALKTDMLKKIHEGHLGMEKCKRRAKAVLYWPKMNNAIEDTVRTCETCIKYRNKQLKEPMWVEENEKLAPWSKVGIDLFTLYGKDYVLLMDYYSHYPEMALLKDTTASTVMTHIKSFFARHGIPETVRTDNGPQFSCQAFRDFSEEYGFTHVTSSPLYPQSNGLVENGVKIVKLLIKKALDSGSDPYLALLNYRDAPLKHGQSPAELLFNRKLKTRLPVLIESEAGQGNNKVLHAKQKTKCDQKRHYDKGAKVLSTLYPKDRVKMHDGKNWNIEARVVKGVAPRSYDVMTPEGVTYRRNRRHLLLVPQSELVETQEGEDIPQTHTDVSQTAPGAELTPVHTPEPVEVRKSGRAVKAPQRLIEQM